MKKKMFTFLFIGISIITFAQNAAEFQDRIRSLQKELPEFSVVMLFSKPENNDTRFRYRQESNFYYFSGFNEPNAIIYIDKRQATLILKGRDPDDEKINKIKNDTGFRAVRTYDDFLRMLPFFLRQIETIYTNSARARIDRPMSETLTFFKELKDRFFDFKLKNVTELSADLRVIHTEEELKLMQKAIDITDNVHLEMMKSAKPGMYEYQLEAILDYVSKDRGAMQLGFEAIIGTGKNGLEPHYSANSDIIKDGDLIVIDIGAEYKMYTADITRTIPASGKFTETQKKFYNIVLKSQIGAIEAVKPGAGFMEPYNASLGIIQEELEKMGFINKGDRRAVRRYMKHTISHFLGLDVHDVGNTREKLKPGMVITIEPALYIPEHNFAIRIEDDVLVTETGFKVLSKAPKTIEEIEMIMREK
jgi:Xaa-Pro aminopeptidase